MLHNLYTWFFFLSVHLGVLPPAQYQKAGYATVLTAYKSLERTENTRASRAMCAIRSVIFCAPCIWKSWTRPRCRKLSLGNGYCIFPISILLLLFFNGGVLTLHAGRTKGGGGGGDYDFFFHPQNLSNIQARGMGILVHHEHSTCVTSNNQQQKNKNKKSDSKGSPPPPPLPEYVPISNILAYHIKKSPSSFSNELDKRDQRKLEYGLIQDFQMWGGGAKTPGV